MLEIIQNMDWVLKTTAVMWLIAIVMRAGLAAAVAAVLVALAAFLPAVGVVTGIIGVIAYWVFLILRWVFTVWSIIILLGYLL